MLKLLPILVIIFLMLNDENILYKIRNSNLFNPKLKQELISYFGFISLKQKNNILEALDIEQKIIKDFLITLKNIEVLDFYAIKSAIDKNKKDNIRLIELNEKILEDAELNNIISNL
ncbi:MAG: hypothetical protein PHS49_00510 [Candidatus Gracilibacteria bacterium]|nr:hypothetical protein [Candidatus Gracilibacteria bacterium]